MEYLSKFIPGMGSIIDQMYGDVSPEIWKQFATGLEGLQWIVSSFEFLRYLYSADSMNHSKISALCLELDKIIRELDQRLHEDDLVGTADIFQYELLPCLEKYQSELVLAKG
ncbi:hypothetical protein D3C81_1941040 [compost metagenome]